MGYYIETSQMHGKAEEIVRVYGAMITTKEVAAFTIAVQELPYKDAIIIVADNGPFEAAVFAYDKREFDRFTHPDDHRPKQFLWMPWDLAVKLTGYRERKCADHGPEVA